MSGSLSKHLNYQSPNAQNIRSGETENIIFETYKNFLMPHGFHSCQTEYDMNIDTMWAYPLSQHSLPYCKFVLRCCDNLPCIDISTQ